MDEPYDSICGIIMVAFLLYTYRCTLRIYNTFKFDENDETSWNLADTKEKRKNRGKDVGYGEGEGNAPLNAAERERLLDDFFENLNNDVLTDLMKESRQQNPQLINHLYKQSLHKGFLKAEDSLEAKKSYLLTLISSSVERMSESLTNVRASFSNRFSLSALPALPRVSLQEMPMLPRMSFTGAASTVPTSSEQEQTDPSVTGDQTARSSFRGSLQSLMSPQPSITALSVAGDLPAQNPLHSARPSINASARPSFTASARPSVSHPYPPPSSTAAAAASQNRGSLGLRGSLQSMRSPTPSIDILPRQSLRGSITAIGNQISFMNPLPSFLRDSRTFKDPREIELETHSPPPIRVIVGELTAKMVPYPKRKNNSGASSTSSLFSSALCSTCTAPSKVEKWIKCYFVLKGITLYFYENEFTFITSPDSPLNKEEPISLIGYDLKRGLPVPPFAFSLKVRSLEEQEKGIKKTLRFRCDNISIFKHWTERLEEILDELLQQEIMKEFL
jgi:hypothetical protein